MKVESLKKRTKNKPELNKIAYGWTILGVNSWFPLRIQKKKKKNKNTEKKTKKARLETLVIKISN